MSGRVYALINASLPGMVKVGTTERNPEDRAKELSSATGVPTPFLVAYSVEVSNCNEAEAFVHERLTLRGFRVAENREFFRAPLDQVVSVLLECAEEYKPSLNSFSGERSSEGKTVANPIEELISEGNGYMTGRDGMFMDFSLAEERFLSAASLGSGRASYLLGVLYYQTPNNPLFDPQKSLKQFRIALDRGVTAHLCYCGMALAYAHLCDPYNAGIAFTKMFEEEGFWIPIRRYYNAHDDHFRQLFTIATEKTARTVESFEELHRLDEERIAVINNLVPELQCLFLYLSFIRTGAVPPLILRPALRMCACMSLLMISFQDAKPDNLETVFDAIAQDNEFLSQLEEAIGQQRKALSCPETIEDPNPI